MTKIYLIHENEEWILPLREELNKLGHPVEEWHMKNGTFDMSEAPPEGVYYCRMSASSYTRGHRFAPEYTFAVLNWLDLFGRRVVNGSKALRLELSKAEQNKELIKFGIKTPKTIFAQSKDDILKAASNFSTPFITKHNRAGKGLGVKLFNSQDELEKYLDRPDFEPSIDGVHILQKYIKADTAKIVRTEFVAGRFLYAVEVDTSGGFELCPADSCDMEDAFCPTNSSGEKFNIINGFKHDNISKYEKLLKANDVEIAGIEYITDKSGQAFTYDINVNTNYNSAAESKYGLKGMKAIAAFLEKELLNLKAATEEKKIL